MWRRSPSTLVLVRTAISLTGDRYRESLASVLSATYSGCRMEVAFPTSSKVTGLGGDQWWECNLAAVWGQMRGNSPPPPPPPLFKRPGSSVFAPQHAIFCGDMVSIARNGVELVFRQSLGRTRDTIIIGYFIK